MNSRTLCPIVVAAVLLTATAVRAVTAAQVQKWIAAGEPITFVDVRSTALYQQGHIPGAINVPAGLVASKELPPLGHVVVYDDGLGGNSAATAATALSQKPGIKADVLEGGLAAWQMAQSPTTETAGLKPEVLPVITYSQLLEAQSSDVVLVDLRKQPDAAVRSRNAVSPTLTDLSAAFPKARVARSPFEKEAGPLLRGKDASATTPPLLVLIDSGDGAAQEMARTLKANGVSRFVILAGGEEILARKGEKGLQRLGSTIEVRRPSKAPSTSTSHNP